MGHILNGLFNDNEFERMTRERYFVDKSEMISKINNIIGKKDRYICITRPRRFGKTVNAMMLACYYSKNANFKNLFDKLEVSSNPSYLEHLNKYNVIYLTFSEMPKINCTYEEFIDRYVSLLINDLKSVYENLEIDPLWSLSDLFTQVYSETREGFIFILDEWDYIFNNKLFSEAERESFLQFLKDLLKDKPYVELAYMTGVLPIAKYSSGSALNMFDEYTFLNDDVFDDCFGFAENEIERLCAKQTRLQMSDLKEWYNGYHTCGKLDIYNPKSVTLALRRGSCQSYWTNTGPMDEISYYIENNIEAVRDDIVRMVSGIPVHILLEGYSAEKISLNTRDEILSAMTVYGFLSYYDEELRIPNKELRIKFDYALRSHKMGEISKLVLQSNEMLEATIKKDTKTMERLIQEAHDINIPIIKYNDENSLACVITLVYLNARSQYKVVREMPAGIGFADFIFFPNNKSKPAFIIELKKDSTPEEALKQIREKRYARALDEYTGQKLAVGISYDSKLKTHKIKVEDV